MNDYDLGHKILFLKTYNFKNWIFLFPEFAMILMIQITAIKEIHRKCS